MGAMSERFWEDRPLSQLDRATAQCSDYRHRRAYVPDCVRLTSGNVDTIDWLPSTCAYRLRAEGKPLFDWH
jgi:uncharacterized cysteine cluster protein YcgN (CxxCxxCC family)